MKSLIFIASLFVSMNLFAMKDTPIDSAKIKTLEIIKTLNPYFSHNMINLKEIEAGKDGFEGSAVSTLVCNNVKNVDLPNGNKEQGIKCRIGLGSGLSITFDSKLNPIRIEYFVP